MCTYKKNKTYRVLIFFYSIFVACLANAQPILMDNSSSNISSLRLKINLLEERANSKEIPRQEQFILIQQIKHLQEAIDACNQNSAQKLKQINQLFKDISPANTVPFNYLKREYKTYSTDAAYCKFYTYRLEELENQIKSLKPIDETSYLLEKNKSLVQLFNESIHPSPLNQSQLTTMLNLNFPEGTNLVLLAILLMTGLLLKLYWKKHSPQWLKKRAYSQVFSDLPFIAALLIASLCVIFFAKPNNLFSFLLYSLSIYLLSIFFIKNVLFFALNKVSLDLLPYWRVFLILYSWFHSWLIVLVIRDEKDSLIITLVSLIYPLIGIAFVEGILLFLSKAKNWLTVNQAKQLESKIILFISLVFLSYVSYVTLTTLSGPTPFLELYKVILIALLNLSLVYLLEFMLNITGFFKKGYPSNKRRFFYQIGLRSIFLLSLILLGQGYQNFALLLLPNLILSAIVLFLIWDVSRFISKLFHLLYTSNEPLAKKLRAVIALKPKERLIELLLLRAIINIPVLAIMLSGLAEFWSLSPYTLAYHFNNIHLGYNIFGFVIHIALIIRAFNVFCIVALSGRILAAYIERKHLVYEERHTRYMLTSLIRYFSFGIAVALALYIAQVNTKGILVIIGAFSVGIGFGLQSFVNNFISGVILMFHKPLRIGDHVVVQNTEGYVKKIGALTTEVRTIFQTDIIIPNSTLINESVTNLTRHDKLNRIQIKIRINDTTKLELAKQLLLDSTKRIKGINQEPNHQPFVLYQLNSLTLWCVIYEINDISTILSELSFEIMNIFNQNKIDIIVGN
ncbi:mechanosensitive ion channel family protein [Legionella sp. km772]|uniref:mechanosensitive ion channel family protein n=1 Tax=Legionella sp. km772 TaxID=2498111 RepID=UPI000F8E7BD4|nr:mechanosensitive ion channel domain-containing protein [Legionella sp. km772]RUR10965.1 mechanosensitive ion channel [Legionella sp. km772]